MVKEFEFFLGKGDVKKQSPDKNLSSAALKESIERLQLSKDLLNKFKAKYVLENAYEAMREAADSVLYGEGFKSFSHEASISYLTRKGFSEQDISEFDRFRKIRNDIKYYGKDCDESDAKSAIKLAEKIIMKIRGIAKNGHSD
jgi:uncharacterized protein (UPF0332 family)